MSRPSALVEILCPGRVLTAEDVVFLAAELEPAWKRRARRLDDRDTAIKDLLKRLDVVVLTPAAVELSIRLNRYLAGLWNADVSAGGPPSDAASDRQMLYRIAFANDGKGMGWRQVARIALGDRSCQNLSSK